MHLPDKTAIFYYVSGFLLGQGVKSTIEQGVSRGTCMYRGPEKRKCAIGCIIDDQFYSSSFEKKDINYAGVIEAVNSSLGREIDDEEKRLLAVLQDVHDMNVPSDWPQRLEAVRERYHL